MAAPELRLEVSLNLLGFRSEIQKLTNIAQNEFTPKINVKFNRQTLDLELNNLQRAIKRRVYHVEIGGNIDSLPDKIKALKEQLASLESFKVDLGIGAVKSLSKRDASKIKSDLRAEILGEQKKIYVPVSIKPSIVKKDVLDFKNAVQSKLSGITVKVKADLEAASISGGAKSRSDIDADVRRKLQEISEIGAQRMAGGGGGVTEAARRAQLKRSLETGGFDIGGLKDIGKQLGITNAARYKNANNLINKIVADASIEMVKKYLDPQAVMRNPDRSGLGKVLDTFARGIFNMLGMDPASIRAQQQSSKPKPFTPAGLLPAFTLKGAREEMMRQLTEGISSSAAGGGGRDGKLALTNASNMAVQSVKVREIFDPREFEFATLRLFRVIGDALESASNQAESASNQAKNARIDQSVGALMQSIDNAIKVGRARVRNVSSLLSGKVDVRDLGRSNLLKGVSPVGLLPPAVGRAPGAYRSSPGESQEELFARRTREAYINSAARAADVSQSPLALPPARDRVLGQPPLMTAPSIGGSRARPMGMTGSAPPDGPSGGGAEANAFVDASRKALTYNQALTGLRESIRGVQVAQLPLIGGIKGLAGEFGQATKQVLLYGTAYKGLAFLTSLPGEAFNAAKALGTYKNQLQAVTSETGTFSNSLAFVDNLAQRFNVPLESARQGFVKLYASMQPTGFSQEQIEGLFTGISQASAAFGLSADKVDRVNYAFAQMASKGQIMSEELKGQLGDVLPGALSLFAEAAKMSIPEFSKAMEDGAFKGKAMMQVLENVGILMKVKFGAAATGAAKTLQGALNGIQNNLKLMYEAFGPVVNRMAAVFGPKITSLIKNVTDVIKAFEAGVSTTGDSFAAMSPQAQGFYSSIQNSLPPIKALIPSLAAAAQNIGYFASSLATASQPLMGLLKLALDFISIPFVARVGVYATVISVLTSAFTLLKNTGIIQATIAMVRFIATLTVGQVQAWISSIQAAITALVAMARTANIAKLSLMALKVTLISFGVGAVLLGLDFVVQKLFNIGSAADDAKRRTAELTDELARAAETGNVAVTSAKLVEAETKVQSLQESKKILQRLQSGGEVPLSEQDYQRLQRAGLAQGISRSLDPLTGKPTGKGRAAGGSSQINESLTTVQSGLVSALNDAGRAQEALTDSMQVQGNMQRALKASRDQMKDIPAATGDGTGTGSAADKARQDAERLASQQQQSAIDAANRQNALDKSRFEGFTALSEQAYRHEINLIDLVNEYRLNGLNSIEARQEKFQQDLQKIELKRIETVRKAQEQMQKAQIDYTAAQRTAGAAGAGSGNQAGGGAVFGDTGRTFNAKGWVHGHFQNMNKSALIEDTVDVVMKLLEQGVKPELSSGAAFGAGMGREQVTSLVRRGIESHKRYASGASAIDVFVPQGTPVPVPLSGVGDLGGAAGVTGSLARSTQLMHLDPKSKSGAARTMERRSAKAGGTAGVEQQDLLYKGMESGLSIINATTIALKERENLIAANINTIFPVAEQRLENDLMKMRNQLQLQGMPQEYIAFQEQQYKTTYEAAEAIKRKKQETMEYSKTVEALQAKQAQGKTLTSDEAESLRFYTEAIRQNDQALTDLIEKEKAYNIAALESAIASIKNADALKAQQDAIQLIDSNVESATGSYKNFIKEVIQGGDPSEALKKFQEAITDQVLTITLDFAMKPIEEFYKNALKNIFGLPTEEKQRQDVLTKMEAQLAQQRDIAASTKQTAVNTTPGGSVPGAQAVPTIPFGESADAAQSMATIGDAFSSGLSAVNTSAQGWNQALNFGLPSVISTSAQQIGQQGGVLGNSLGSVTGVIGAAASSIMGIVAGVSQMGSGGTSGVLGGIGSIFMGLGGALGGIGGMFGGGLSSAFSGGASSAIGTGASGWSTAFATPLRFANGGMVTGPTLGLVGEGKYNEAIVPLPDGRSIPVQMKGASGGGLREAMSGNNGKASGSPILNMSFQSTNINGVEYVSRDQLEAAMATTRKQAAKDGANRGMSMTLDKLQQSPQTRNRLGMR